MGGGAMRAAAKMVGISAAGGGIIGMTAEHYSAARKAASARPVAATSEELKLAASNSDAALQKSSSEMDEWVFPDAEEAAGEQMPRVVFGGVPTLKEAQEATSELSAALENAYLSAPKSVEKDGYVAAEQDSVSKAGVTNQLAVASSVPAPAIMAFKFLHESSVAQNVVASIACDQNVWNAVLQNEDLQQFLQSHSPSGSPSESYADSDGAEQYFTPGFVEDYDTSKDSEYGFVDVFQKMKSSVTDMVSNLSDYMQTLFGAKGSHGLLMNSDGATRVSAEAVMNASFMGLAMMAILVIMLKRANPV